MRKILLVLSAALLGLGVLAPAALAAPGNTPRPDPANGLTARAGGDLYKACRAFEALYTPIPVGTAPVADDPATPAVNEANATIYVFRDKAQCRRTVDNGGAIGLLDGLPASVISVVAPQNFPTPPRSVTPPPAVAVLEGVANGSATAPFTFTVRGTGLTANADVSALVTYRDGRSVVVVVGKTNAEGVVTYPVAGACVKSQVPTAVTLLQLPAGPAATVSVPAQVCAGV